MRGIRALTVERIEATVSRPAPAHTLTSWLSPACFSFAAALQAPGNQTYFLLTAPGVSTGQHTQAPLPGPPPWSPTGLPTSSPTPLLPPDKRIFLNVSVLRLCTTRAFCLGQLPDLIWAHLLSHCLSSSSTLLPEPWTQATQGSTVH